MTAPGQPWPLHTKVIACVFHTLAICSGIFRSMYRWYISRFGWEDTWAVLALLTDVGCLICAWLEKSSPLHLSTTDVVLNLVSIATLTSVLWEARLSMVVAIIRITFPHASMRRTSYAIAIAFGLMWIAVLAQKLYVCYTQLCSMTHGVAITQLITDVISDTLLVVTPVFFLKDVKVSRGQRILLLLLFASSICITIVSIAHTVSLYLPLSSSRLLLIHIKAALAVIICNLLVIVTFAYRFYHKTDIELNGIPIESERIQFTTVIPVSFASHRNIASDPSLN